MTRLWGVLMATAMAVFLTACMTSRGVEASNRYFVGAPSSIQGASTRDNRQDERSQTTCWPGFTPEKNDHMSTCCWYGAQTCCKSSVAGHILPVVERQLELAYKNGTHDQCYIAVADLLCLWCNPETSYFAQGDRYLTLSICPSMCKKLWDSCLDQQATFGINPAALTWRQFCTALLVEEEEEDSSEGGVRVNIVSEDSHECYAGTSLSVVSSSNCVPHVTSGSSPSYGGPSGGAIAAMILVPFIIIGLTAVAVVAYFRVRKRREALYLSGNGDEFSLPADSFGEEGGFLDEEGDFSEGSGGNTLLDDEDSRSSIQ